MWDLVLAVVGLLTALYWYMTTPYGYWRKRGVYSLPGVIPGVGHLWDAFVFKKGTGLLHCEMYNQAKGHPAVGIYSFRKPELLLRDINLIQTVLVKEFSNFHDNIIRLDEKLDFHASRNPFILTGERWKTMRQRLTPALSSSKLLAMFPLIQVVCQEFNSYIKRHLDENINVNYVMDLFTSEIVAKCAFAVDGNAFKDSNSEFYQQGRKLWDSSINDPIKLIIAEYFPFINKLLRKSFFPKDVTDFFSRLIKQAADYRANNPDKAPNNDYLQYLLNLTKKDPGFTIEDVAAQSLTFFTDGFETTSVMISYNIYELAINPEIQEAVRQEIKAMESFNCENVVSLPLLNRVFQETTRKYSIFSMIKECTKDTVLETDGHTFPMYKGQRIIVPVYAIHHDPDIYPDPERFEPDRFLPENVKNRHPLTHMGFGAGPRMCIGLRFATSLAKILTANILANFRLLKCEQTLEKMKLSPYHIMTIPDKDIWIKFQEL